MDLVVLIDHPKAHQNETKVPDGARGFALHAPCEELLGPCHITFSKWVHTQKVEWPLILYVIETNVLLDWVYRLSRALLPSFIYFHCSSRGGERDYHLLGRVRYRTEGIGVILFSIEWSPATDEVCGGCWVRMRRDGFLSLRVSWVWWYEHFRNLAPPHPCLVIEGLSSWIASFFRSGELGHFWTECTLTC